MLYNFKFLFNTFTFPSFSIDLDVVPVGLATTVLTPIDTSQDIALPRRVGTAPAHTTRPRYHRIGQIFDYDHPDLGY